MNQTERRYADLLDRRSDVAGWWFEEITFKLGPDCRLTTDFMVQLESGLIEFHEVKGGFARDDSAAKFRVAANRYPFVFRWCVWDKNGWKVTTPFPQDRDGR